MASIAIERIEKIYPNGHVAARRVDLRIEHGEFIVLVGPSGCGKSTLLRLIAGLEVATAGRLAIDDQDMTGVPPQDRDLAMVFQSYALYPHMSVRQNLEYGLRVRGIAPADIASRVTRVAGSLGLDGMLERRPAQLSGGQRQRVALGRAIVREPKAFLFDEPLSNLDPALRAQARAELLQLHRALGATIVYVTHDQEEAMTLGTRVAVMHDGRIEQIAPPLDLYARPANTFVARFIGSPPMNLLPPSVAVALTGPALPDHPDSRIAAAATVGLRPHDISIRPDGVMNATIDLIEPRGHDLVVHLTLRTHAAPALVAIAPPHASLTAGAPVCAGSTADRLHLFGPDGARVAGD